MNTRRDGDGKTRPFDAARYLDSEEAIHEYLVAACEDGDPDEIAHALGVIARARKERTMKSIIEKVMGSVVGRLSIVATVATLVWRLGLSYRSSADVFPKRVRGWELFGDFDKMASNPEKYLVTPILETGLIISGLLLAYAAISWAMTGRNPVADLMPAIRQVWRYIKIALIGLLMVAGLALIGGIGWGVIHMGIERGHWEPAIAAGFVLVCFLFPVWLSSRNPSD